MKHPLLVISLKRTPERLRTFLNINEDALIDWDVNVINGIDGLEQEEINRQSRWVSASAVEYWTKGAIGSALSHIKAWRRCIEMNQEVLVVEDDAVLANDLKRKLEELKILGSSANQAGLILLGWITDSLIQAEMSPGLELISLFEPLYPKNRTNKSDYQQRQGTLSLQIKPMLRITCILDQATGSTSY